MKKLETAIIQALAYADAFNCSLTKHEVHMWLVSNTACPIIHVEKSLKNLVAQGKIHTAKDCYALSKKNLNKNRIERKKYSQEKQKIAEKYTALLALIPTIQLIGISGSVAMGNATKNDDIDLYIVCTKNTVWLTRLLTIFTTELTGRRRRPKGKTWNNALCLNMFVDELCLAIPKKEQDLFAAHEVLQMQPVFDRGVVYSRFLSKNRWIARHLKNGWELKSQNLNVKGQRFSSKVKCALCSFICRAMLQSAQRFIEPMVKKLQLWYMRNKRTNEVVTDTYIRLHPHDAREWVLRRYQKSSKSAQKK